MVRRIRDVVYFATLLLLEVNLRQSCLALLLRDEVERTIQCIVAMSFTFRPFNLLINYLLRQLGQSSRGLKLSTGLTIRLEWLGSSPLLLSHGVYLLWQPLELRPLPLASP